jgi:hypothetical protein
MMILGAKVHNGQWYLRRSRRSRRRRRRRRRRRIILNKLYAS